MEHENYIVNYHGELLLYYDTNSDAVEIPFGVRKICKGSLPYLRYMNEESYIVIPPTVADFSGLELPYTPDFTIRTWKGSEAERYAIEKGIRVELE